jgi:multidrug efflux system membrane fusion protein
MSVWGRIFGRGMLAGAAGLAVAVACTAAGEGPGRGRGDAGAPVPITAAAAVRKPMPVEIGTFGTVEANATVTVKPQITGVIKEVLFKDGQVVTKGGGKDPETGKPIEPTLLFRIDDRPFKADLDRAKAQLKNAQNEFDRQRDLFKAGGTTESAYQQAEANLATAKAAVEVAALNFEYCTITSPIDGRAGECLVDAGNMVKSGDAALVVIKQLQPIQVSFAVPQQNLAEIKARMAAGRLQVKAFIPGQDQPETGELVFVDNAVDQSTGTIRLKAEFANKAERLWPGQFVTVKVVLRVEPDAVVIPSKAVQNGQRGLYLFVVAGDGTEQSPLVAKKREPVTVDREIGEESVISSGNVQPGETVVTDGQLRLGNDTRVTIKTAENKPEAGKDQPGEKRAPGKGGAKPSDGPAGKPRA